VKTEDDSRYQDYGLESVIPTEADIENDTATFNIKVTPRAGKLPSGGKLYFKLESSYEGDVDVSFGGTVTPDENDGKFIARPTGMPYIAGDSGDGISVVSAVADLTSSDATLGVVVFGDGSANSKSGMIDFMKAITVEYAWVDTELNLNYGGNFNTRYHADADNQHQISKFTKVGDSVADTAAYDVKTADAYSGYTDYVLDVLPINDTKSISISVAPRSNVTPTGGNLYLFLHSIYGNLLCDAVVKLDETTNKYVANPSDMPYIAGRNANKYMLDFVVEVPSNGIVLDIPIKEGHSTTEIASSINGMSIDYAWVDEAV
jgi:hypothetical protein